MFDMVLWQDMDTRVCVCVYDETTALLMASAERKIIF